MPDLTAKDRELLHHWFSPLSHLLKIAAKHKMDLVDLRAWADKPHVDAALAELELFVERHAKAVALSALSTTTSALNEVCAETDLDPETRRKAATVLHRTALKFHKAQHPQTPPNEAPIRAERRKPPADSTHAPAHPPKAFSVQPAPDPPEPPSSPRPSVCPSTPSSTKPVSTSGCPATPSSAKPVFQTQPNPTHTLETTATTPTPPGSPLPNPARPGELAPPNHSEPSGLQTNRAA